MTVQVARPDVSDMVFIVFDRSVHPELFSPVKTQFIEHAEFSARTSVCSSGHVIEFQLGRFPITEVATTRQQSLPNHKRSCSRRLVGQRDQMLEFESGVRYHGCYQLEKLDAEIFMNVHEELSQDIPKASIGHAFNSPSRFAPAPISVIQTDVTPNALLVHTYHTFPENCAVVKTQSLFELI
ncbi:MAG: DUF2617 family protein [Planctomycetaceae bacterium]